MHFSLPDIAGRWTGAGILIVLVLQSGCAWQPTAPQTVAAPSAAAPAGAADMTGASIARHALATLGTPYQYGGATISGFDCSGLVQYAHGKEGIAVPRTAAQQKLAASPVTEHQLRPGDLVFFRIGRKVAHVGIYVDEGRFVHAPSTGNEVRMERLDSAFYAARIAGMGRFR